MSGLEERSGAKTLLKLLLDKTNDVLTQSAKNEFVLNELVIRSQEQEDKLILIIQQLEEISGVNIE